MEITHQRTPKCWPSVPTLMHHNYVHLPPHEDPTLISFSNVQLYGSNIHFPRTLYTVKKNSN